MVFGRLAHLPNFKEEEDDEDEDDSSDGSHPAPGDGGHDDHLVELEGGVHDKVVHVLLGFLEDPVRVKCRLDRRAGKHPGREG